MSVVTSVNTVSIKKPLIWSCSWATLVLAYVFSVQQGFFLKEWDYLIFLLQLGCDVFIGVMAFLAYQLRKNKIDRTFYLLILISIVPGLFANEIYNILINIKDISRSNYARLYWSAAYTLFLLLQILAWGYLLKMKVVYRQATTKRWLTVSPYIQAFIIISLSLISIISLRYRTDEYISVYRIVNSVLEIMVFMMMALSLSRTKNGSLICLITGFLLLVGFNFAHRFSDISSLYFKVFNVVWLLSLVVISQGLWLSILDRKKNIKFFEENSIHVLTSGAFILFANLILIAFTVLVFGMAMLQIDKIPNIKIMALDIPSALVICYSLTVLLAKHLAQNLSMPLDLIVRKIDRIAAGNFVVDNKCCFEISELKKMESFIINTISELHYANHVKSEFIMNMSHDFRTPASGILHMSKLIHSRISDDSLRKLQKMVVNSSEQLMSLLEDVFDYSRLENGQLTVNNSDFNLTLILNELISLMQTKAHENNVKITIGYFDKPFMYCNDKSLIQRVILNILSNAVKFTHGGVIHVSMDIAPDNQWIMICISETGPGIPENKLDAIFEPFFKLEPACSAKYPGIGLGLSNAKLMLSKIGGKISVISRVSVGSKFCIHLPL